MNSTGVWLPRTLLCCMRSIHSYEKTPARPCEWSSTGTVTRNIQSYMGEVSRPFLPDRPHSTHQSRRTSPHPSPPKLSPWPKFRLSHYIHISSLSLTDPSHTIFHGPELTSKSAIELGSSISNPIPSNWFALCERCPVFSCSRAASAEYPLRASRMSSWLISLLSKGSLGTGPDVEAAPPSFVWDWNGLWCGG